MRQLHQRFTKSVKQSKKTILLIAIAVLVTLLLSALISSWLSERFSLHIPSLATIETIGVKAYWDSNLSNETTELSWPKVYPGTSNNVTLYLQSVSNVKTRLELRASDWTFRNSGNMAVLGPVDRTNYMNLTWNYNNATIDSGQALQVILTLSTDRSDEFVWFLVNNNVKAFSFDIMISAREDR